MGKQHSRVLSKSLSLQYNNAVYQISQGGQGYTLRGATVTVCERTDGEVTIIYKGGKLEFTRYQRGESVPAPADGKEVNQRVDQAAAKQGARASSKPVPNHPWRKSAAIPPKGRTERAMTTSAASSTPPGPAQP